MAKEKTEEKAKPTLAMEFRKKLKNREQFKATITEGLKSANSRVRSLAIKAAFKLKDHSFVKQNVLPLITSDKSKKVLRAISQKITRRDLYKKVKASRVMKKFGGKKETAETDAGATAPAAVANEAKPS